MKIFNASPRYSISDKINGLCIQDEIGNEILVFDDPNGLEITVRGSEKHFYVDIETGDIKEI